MSRYLVGLLACGLPAVVVSEREENSSMRKQLCFWLTGSLVAFASATAHAEDEPKPYPECTKEPTEAEAKGQIKN